MRARAKRVRRPPLPAPAQGQAPPPSSTARAPRPPPPRAAGPPSSAGPPPAGVAETDCAYEDTTAPMDVIAQRVWNGEALRAEQEGQRLKIGKFLDIFNPYGSKVNKNSFG